MKFIETYWMPFLYWLFLGLITYLIKKVKDYHNMLNNTSSAIREILKNEIIGVYNKCKEKDCITLQEKDIIESLYTEYKNNGGNGFIDELMKEIKNIPFSSDCDGGD